MSPKMIIVAPPDKRPAPRIPPPEEGGRLGGLLSAEAMSPAGRGKKHPAPALPPGAPVLTGRQGGAGAGPPLLVNFGEGARGAVGRRRDAAPGAPRPSPLGRGAGAPPPARRNKAGEAGGARGARRAGLIAALLCSGREMTRGAAEERARARLEARRGARRARALPPPPGRKRGRGKRDRAPGPAERRRRERGRRKKNVLGGNLALSLVAGSGKKKGEPLHTVGGGPQAVVIPGRAPTPPERDAERPPLDWLWAAEVRAHRQFLLM